MITRLRRAWGTLESERRRVALAAGLVLLSLLLPWYTKTITAITRNGLSTQHEAKMAITVPSFVEASIFLVAVAVLGLMFARGEKRAFHLPFGDGIVVTAAGAWVAFLVFFRFISHPGDGSSRNISYEYGLSWGIFFGLLAAAFLLYSGARLRLAQLPEPPLPGEGPAAPAGSGPARPATEDREARRQRRAAARAAARGEQPPAAPVAEREPEPAEPPTAVAPPPPATTVAPARRPRRPEIDGGEQLSFDEQE